MFVHHMCVCIRGPAKYGGYRSNHLRARVSPGTRVALRIRACARIVRIMYVCAYVKIRSTRE